MKLNDNKEVEQGRTLVLQNQGEKKKRLGHFPKKWTDFSNTCKNKEFFRDSFFVLAGCPKSVPLDTCKLFLCKLLPIRELPWPSRGTHDPWMLLCGISTEANVLHKEARRTTLFACKWWGSQERSFHFRTTHATNIWPSHGTCPQHTSQHNGTVAFLLQAISGHAAHWASSQ